MPLQPPSLDAEVGGASSNSYLEVDEAEELLSQYPQNTQTAAWFALTADEKARGLIAATMVIDGLPFVGCKADRAQRLQFPRHIAGYRWSEAGVAEIPPEVKVATSFLAVHLGQGGGGIFAFGDGANVGTGATGLDQFDSVTLGPISVKLKDDNTLKNNFGDLRSMVPPAVLSLLQPFLGGAAGVYSGLNYRDTVARRTRCGLFGASNYTGTMRVVDGKVYVRPEIGSGWASWQSGTSSSGGL